jgi:2-hydroxy-6-oxonona-2,4-dienedioate hydrolase
LTSFWNTMMACRPVIRWLDIDGITIRLASAGPDNAVASDKPVILIHGASGHLESFVRTLPILARSRTVIAYDLPWHGYSGCPAKPFDVHDYARHLARLADRLKLSEVSLVGQSLGATIAARAAVDGLLPVDRMILICAAGAPRFESAAGSPWSMLSDLPAPTYELVKRRLEHALAARGPEVDELIDSRFRAYQFGNWEDRVRAFSYHEEPGNRARTVLTESEWRQINCPTMLIWGEQDKITPPSTGETLARLIPGAVLRIFPGCGHNPQFEQPDLVNPVLEAFLASPA